MKFQKVLLIVSLAIFLNQAFIAQEKPKPELIDKFSYIDNDPLQARIFNLISTVKNASIDSETPFDSKGFIIIHSSKENSLDKYLYKRKIKNCFGWAKIPTKGFEFFFGKDEEEFSVELWKFSNGTDESSFERLPENYFISSLSKPKLVYSSVWEEEYCPLGFNLEFYSKFLKNTPNLIGNVVIAEKSLKKFNSAKQKIASKIMRDHKVLPQQLRFSRKKYEEFSEIEYWFLPLKKI